MTIPDVFSSFDIGTDTIFFALDVVNVTIAIFLLLSTTMLLKSEFSIYSFKIGIIFLSAVDKSKAA